MIARALAPCARHLPEAWVLDKKAVAQYIAGLAKTGLVKFALYTAIGVTAIVYLSLASVELVAATLVPLVFGVLWTFGLMGLLKLPIDIMNSVFVIFIIGIGEDYSVFLVTCKLDEWRGRPQRLASTSASVTISALTTIFGFAVLVFAKHPVLYSMGTTVLLGMVCTFVATLILTQLCMDLLLFADPPRGAPRWWHLFRHRLVWDISICSRIVTFRFFGVRSIEGSLAIDNAFSDTRIGAYRPVRQTQTHRHQRNDVQETSDHHQQSSIGRRCAGDQEPARRHPDDPQETGLGHANFGIRLQVL